jgi:allophanate hydrolase subunit 2
MTPYFKTLSSGLLKAVQAPQYGRQDVGISPGGAMDRFACECGQALLGSHVALQSWEILIASRIQFETDVCFILTGARHQPVQLADPADQHTSIEHAQVYWAAQGSCLNFGEKQYGFRAYLTVLPADRKAAVNLAGRQRPPYAQLCNFGDSDDRIRVLPGPEYAGLKNPQDFLNHAWRTTQDMSDMGMRLASPTAVMLDLNLPGMISAPVADGAIQLTPNGPIILLRHRQTVGGYPRIFNVISADIDRLAQFAPEQVMWFKETTLDQARIAARRRQMILDDLKRNFISDKGV